MSTQPSETPITECDECGNPLDAIDGEELPGTCMDCEAKHYITPVLDQPSETPLTDAAWQYCYPECERPNIDFARTLERELAARDALIGELTELGNSLASDVRMFLINVGKPTDKWATLIAWDEALRRADGKEGA